MDRAIPEDEVIVPEAIDIQEISETEGYEHVRDNTNLGNIFIDNNVIAVIAKLAALKVPGVIELSNTSDAFAGMLGKKGADRGIRIQKEGDDIKSIDLTVVLEYGARIPHVCWQIQNDIVEAVDQMTGKTVEAVNIVVQGIRLLEDSNRDIKELEAHIS